MMLPHHCRVAGIALGGLMAWATGVPGLASVYLQTNLVSDQANQAKFQDPNLVNSWGIAHGPATPWWVSDNGTGVSTLYNGAGVAQPLVVTLTPPPSATAATPTGVVFHANAGFDVSNGSTSGPARFLWATEDGQIEGWNPSVDATHAVVAVAGNTATTVYKGLALGTTSAGEFLYAANFRKGTVDVFDSKFASATLLGNFADPNPQPGFAPFSVRNINGQLFVSYAKQDPLKHDDVAGVGNGYINVFNTNGQFLKRFATAGTLNSPWGMTQAPASGFGQFSHDLLVGNFGDGLINAFDPTTGAFLGHPLGPNGQPITIDGLWGLDFGNGTKAGGLNELFFAAGPNGEQNGLFGKITALGGGSTPAIPEPTSLMLLPLALGGLTWRLLRKHRA